MNRALFRQRTIWWPTGLGWFCLLFALASLTAVCVLWGESWLSVTDRVPANILVVEGWIHTEGMPVAKSEFKQGGYDYLVVSGGPSGPSWSSSRYNLAEYCKTELLRLGFPANKLFSAPTDEKFESQRTYQSAMTVKHLLETKKMDVRGINVLSRGPHCRRTRMVFSKVFGPGTSIGIVAWRPYAAFDKPWWKSSERTKEMITESFGFLYEWTLDSGRPQGSRRLWTFLAFVAGIALAVYVRRRLKSSPAKAPVGVPPIESKPFRLK